MSSWKKWHWTAQMTFGIALATVVSALWLQWASLETDRFERAIVEAGGAVHFDFGGVCAFHLGGKSLYLVHPSPVAVEIRSGSHPIPPELAHLSKMPSVKCLALNTSQIGDGLLPLLSTFHHLKSLDLTGTSLFFSAASVITLLDALPALEELQIDEGLLDQVAIQALPHGWKLKVGTQFP